MNVLQINWKDWLENAKTYDQTKWTPTGIDAHFLSHLLPVLGAIPLQYKDKKISATDTLNSLTNTQINTPNGNISGDDIKRIIGVLYMIPRGKLVLGSQIKHPMLGALTPLALHAQKLYNDVPYETWDKTDPMLKFFLGKTLEPLLKPFTMPHLTTNDIKKFRADALTYHSGNKSGTMAALTAYKCNLHAFKFKKEEDAFDDPEYDGEAYYNVVVPQIAIMMKLQIWLANAAIRKPGVMILDPKNWDAVPEALDAVAPQEIAEEIPWS